MYYPNNFYNYIPTVNSGNQPIMVSGLESAKAYATAPNSNVVLFDNNEDVFYLKSTDASNFPSIRMFRFEEINKQINSAPEEDQPITRAEFNQLMEEIQSIKSNTVKERSKGGKENGK